MIAKLKKYSESVNALSGSGCFWLDAILIDKIVRGVSCLARLLSLCYLAFMDRADEHMNKLVDSFERISNHDSGHNSVKKRVTVLVCDIVESTAIAEALEPEQLQHIIYTYHDYCTSILRGRRGTVTRYMGDDVLAYFEDDLVEGSCARQAILAARDILKDITALNIRTGYALDIRIGLSTGLAMVARSRKNQSAVGKPLHLAARLQSIGRSNQATVCNKTKILLKEKHHFHPLPAVSLKGYGYKVKPWELVLLT